MLHLSFSQRLTEEKLGLRESYLTEFPQVLYGTCIFFLHDYSSSRAEVGTCLVSSPIPIIEFTKCSFHVRVKKTYLRES